MVNDGSGSMTLQYKADDEAPGQGGAAQTKAAAVDGALKGLLRDMKGGRSPENYHFAFVTFNSTVTDERPPTRLRDVSADVSYDPTDKGTGGTAIHRGLDAAYTIVDRYMREARASEVPVSAVVAVMSDGEERDNRAKTEESAARIRALPFTQLAACLFAARDEPADGGDLLESIVSNPELYARAYSASQLRAFFKKSVTATRPGQLARRD
jgi:uncharacterized protein YegL